MRRDYARRRKKVTQTRLSLLSRVTPVDDHQYSVTWTVYQSLFLGALEAGRGGVVSFCVVKATALALVDSNKTPYLREFEPTVTWVKSIYRCCNFTRRAGTTTRPPVPRECLKNVNLHFSPTLKRRGFKFPRGIAISQNPKNYCNEDETLTLIDKLIAPMSRGKERSSNWRQLRKLYWSAMCLEAKKPQRFWRNWYR